MKDIPAFPSTFHNGWGEPEKGMQLRDYFATHAMQGFMGSSWNVKSFEEMATKAYELADAMMKARTDGL
jgi:hypothetical protein